MKVAVPPAMAAGGLFEEAVVSFPFRVAVQRVSVSAVGPIYPGKIYPHQINRKYSCSRPLSQHFLSLGRPVYSSVGTVDSRENIERRPGSDVV
jgi:hypothetical protein